MTTTAAETATTKLATTSEAARLSFWQLSNPSWEHPQAGGTGDPTCWIEDAFIALALAASSGRNKEFNTVNNSCRTYNSNSHTNKNISFCTDNKTSTSRQRTCSKKENLKQLTPRCVGDSLQHLKSLGGWAWIAFA
eukprot:TRINITY_DN3043_c0_g7_i1.p1 TRINITY_DN3043_c0_g7~~TRINITY_DN3043_c0_g7_i1.p1  ORF type:complete len:155 (+),score=27.66 TRINITY_DN3043_c0_g7_i1:59-466(+)